MMIQTVSFGKGELSNINFKFGFFFLHCPFKTVFDITVEMEIKFLFHGCLKTNFSVRSFIIKMNCLSISVLTFIRTLT